MILIPARFIGILVLYFATVSSQTTDESPTEEETVRDTSFNTTVNPTENEITFSTVISSTLNVSDDVTSIWNVSWNDTVEENATQTSIDDTLVTESWTPCIEEVCENGGTCLMNNENTVKCSCPSKYMGSKCEILNNCTTNEEGILCKNGVCGYTDNQKYLHCKCFLGHYWDSQKGECRPPKEPCFPNPCQSGGNCTVKSSDQYQCSCLRNFFGKNCGMEDMCSYNDRGIQCENGYCIMDAEKNRKVCKCDDGYYLDPLSMQCKKRSPPCEPNPCMNNGRCDPISSNKYNCTCKGSYVGARCEILNLCKPDSNGKVCLNGVCKENGNNSKSCLCFNGYFFDESTGECKEMSPPCVPNPCANGGFCNAISPNQFNCSCAKEFYGKQCDLINKCVLEGNKFCNDAACVMNEDNEGYICQCPEFQHFDYGSRKCKVTDVCPLFNMKKNAVCENNDVRCNKNFKENNDTGLCEPNFCETKGCPAAGMVCEENVKNPENYKCSCKEGYSYNGNSCTPAMCTLPTLHKCEQICEEEGDNYSCKCNDLFTLRPDNKTCEYSGNMTCVNTTCKIGQCILEDGEEKCICPPGYEEHDGQCRDKCSAANLTSAVCPDNQCEATASGFRCKCEGKYKLSPDNVTCTVRDMCAQNEYGWKRCAEMNASCFSDWNETLGFTCKCPPGSVKLDSGFCRDICAVEENKLKCSHLGATCSVTGNEKFICRCPPSFQQAKEGSPCNKLAEFSYLVTLPVSYARYSKNKQPASHRMRRSLEGSIIDEIKLWTDITHSMKELYEAFENANILQCTNEGEFLLCTAELQFRETNLASLNRIKDRSSCVSNRRRNDNLCLIPPSLVLMKDKIQSQVKFERTDPCSEVIRSDLCESSTDCKSSLERGIFSCTCKSGFSAHKVTYPLLDTNSVIETCNDIDECAENNPCPKSTTCSNLIGSYNCFCRPGYRRMNDSSDPKRDGCVRVCDHSPCVHGTCKASGGHHFECKCERGFTGILCNFVDQNYKDTKVNTIIVGAVLGGILLIAIIIFISKLSRGHKKFGHESGQLIFGSTEMTERRQMGGGIFNDAFERE